MIAAQNDRKAFLGKNMLDDIGELGADRIDRVEILCVVVDHRKRFPNRYVKVAAIFDMRDADGAQFFMQSRIAHRRRPHIDPATARAEVHRHADDIDAVAHRVLRSDHRASFAAFFRRARSVRATNV